MSNVTPRDVRRALYEQGTSLKAWSEANGFHYNTVQNAVERHTRPEAGDPWGAKTRAILQKLSKVTHLQLIK